MYYFGLMSLSSPVVKYMKPLTYALLIESMQCHEYFFSGIGTEKQTGEVTSRSSERYHLGMPKSPKVGCCLRYLFRQVGGGLGITWEGFVETGGHLTTSPHITESQIFVINKNTFNDDYSCKY